MVPGQTYTDDRYINGMIFFIDMLYCYYTIYSHDFKGDPCEFFVLLKIHKYAESSVAICCGLGDSNG